jgi:hypothetical protein
MGYRKNFFCVATVAAATTSHAWILTSNPSSLSSLSSAVSRPSYTAPTTSTATRLYFSSPLRQRSSNSPNNNNNDDGGILAQIGNAVKSVLPTKWFGTDEEKAALARKKEVKDQVKGSVDDLLRGAPLGVRMMGKMISPLMGSLASTLAEGMAEQQRTTESVMDDVRQYLLSDIYVMDALGTPIQIGAPFSQSSSTTSINGRTQTRIELAMNVAGTRRTGIARVVATESGVAQIIVEAGGKVFNVNLSRKGRPPSANFRGSSGGDDGTIIEAEIIDKDTRRY